MARRRKRQANKLKVLSAIFLVSLLVLVGLLVVQGRIPFLSDGAQAGTPSGSPSATPSAKPSVSAKPSQTPTPTKTPEPTPTPEVTDPNQLILAWENPPSFVSSKAIDKGTTQKKYKDGGTLTYSVVQDGKVVPYKPDYNLAFASGKAYSELEGVTAFRGNNYRNSPSFGTRSVVQKKLEIVWSHDVGAISAANSFWPGVGWTGQPLLVHWPEDVKNIMNITPEMKKKDLVEVIYPILDGNIYFLDLETGTPTRNKITIGYPIKGTGMVDPRGYPLLYTGMGINENNGRFTDFKYRVINLIDQKEIFTFPGKDPSAYRTWGALDSSAVLNRQTDTLIEAAENGMVYKIKMNTNFDLKAGKITVAPKITKYRYKSSYAADQGIENSPAYYRNLMYFIDNGGTLQCLDINSLTPVWIYNVKDDSDSSIVIDETKDGVFLYTANEIDKRCVTSGKKKENANIRKINALTGELIWQKDYLCYYQSYINGGVLGTPLIGKDDISDIIIYPICFTGSTLDGKLVALNKKTGEEVWTRDLKAYSWSSPVDFKSSDGKTYGIFCDFAGDMHLFDPKTGKDLDVISLGGNIEGTPAVYDDMVVVGSYAKKIFGIKIK